MAIKVGGTDVITNARQLSNIASVDSTTVTALGAAGVGGGGGSADFVATGTIPNGAAVGIKTDGTVEVIAKTASNTPTVLDNGIRSSTTSVTEIGIVHCSNLDRYVIVYKDGNNGYLRAVVARIVNNVLTFGAEQNIVTLNSPLAPQTVSYDVAQSRVLVIYTEAAGDSKIYVRGLSVNTTENTLSVASLQKVSDSQPDDNGMCIVYEPNSGKHFVFYNGSGCKAAALTVSASSISVGSELTIKSGNWSHTSATVDTDNNKVIFVYADTNDSDKGYATAISISGTTLSAGTLTEFLGSRMTYSSCTYDTSNDRFVVAYTKDSNNQGYVKVASISGSTLSFGSEISFHADTTYHKSIVYDPDTSRISIGFRDGGNNNKGKVVFGTVSGTSVSFQAETTIEDDEITLFNQAYDTTADKFVAVYRNVTDGKVGYTLYSGTTSNVNSWIGMAAEAISNSSSGKVTIIGGVNEGQSSLTIGSTYYVAENGALQTGSTTVKAGRAIATTKILVTEGNAQ